MGYRYEVQQVLTVWVIRDTTSRVFVGLPCHTFAEAQTWCDALNASVASQEG